MVYIIIPAYNVEKFIETAIKSVQNQSYKEWKMVIVDDGSKDNTFTICKKYTSDSRIHLIHKENQGLFLARMSGLEYCNGYANDDDFITFLDSDDILYDSNSIKNLIDAAQKNNADIVAGGSKRFFGNKIKIKFSNISFNTKTYTNKQIISELYISFFGLSGMPSNVWSKLYKFKVVKDLPLYKTHPKFFAEDQFINIVAFPLAEKLTTINKTVYLYRTGGGTSKFMEEFLNDAILMYNFKKKMIDKYPMPQDALFYTQCELRNMLYFWLNSCLTKGNYSDNQMLEEIKKCANLYEIQEILSVDKVCSNREEKREFAFAIKNGEYNNVLSLLKNDLNKTSISKLTQLIKRII